MSTPERRLAEFVATLSHSDIPESVTSRSGLVIADTIAAIIGGVTEQELTGLIERWQTPSNGGGSILGAGKKSTKHKAAFLNGTAGTTLELDEGHRFAAGHPAIHVLPALLAEGESTYANGEEFTAAFVAGYEAAVRVARGSNPLADGYHPHGVWGAIGSAAAIANLRGFDPPTTASAMRIAANYAQHTRFEAATEGATVRNSFAGMSNLAGLVAADQADAGFTGLEDGIRRHLDSTTVSGFDESLLAAGLGETWELLGGYFKTHAACRYTHPALDAVLELGADSDIHPPDIERILVETYPAAANLRDPDPVTSLQAKFSLPFAVATTIVTGDTGKESFEREAITPPTLDLAARVVVEVGAVFTERLPDKRGARVTIEFESGRSIQAEVEAARGGEHDPLSIDELNAKFERLVAPVIGDDQAGALWKAATAPEPPRVLCTLAT